MRHNKHTYDYALAEKRGQSIVVDVNPKRNRINNEQRIEALPESNRITQLNEVNQADSHLFYLNREFP